MTTIKEGDELARELARTTMDRERFAAAAWRNRDRILTALRSQHSTQGDKVLREVRDEAYKRFVARLESGFAGCSPEFIFDAGYRAALSTSSPSGGMAG